MGHYVEADDEEETRPSAAVPPSVLGAIDGGTAPERSCVQVPLAAEGVMDSNCYIAGM